MMRRLGRSASFTVLLAVFALVVPDAADRPAQSALLRADTATAVRAGRPVVWLLALGSDARPGQPVLRSRSDAIQLVGINTETGSATILGIPRDSYVDIPGFGRDKINAAMVYGGPQLAAQAVAGLVGIRADYVFVTGFDGLTSMVHAVGGIDVRVRHEMSNPYLVLHPGLIHVNGTEALAFARIRYGLPRGDFDRSANQASLLRAGLRHLRNRVRRAGAFESAVYSFLRNTDTDLSAFDLYRLARAVLEVEPSKVRICVVPGTIGSAGGASVVLPDVSAARALAAEVRDDATLTGGCI